ncbi:acylneuraminate cytidylyltransferase [Microbacterium sediminis]|nr:acylneuraminate cytidylyltransferase [Microbacterium sediminis]
MIPARGGSKGVPGKNILRVAGVPLVARAVSAARATPGIDRVVVTTDDDDIASTAAEWGAEIVHRPAELAGDGASSESALIHALDELAARGVEVGVLAFLQATSPFIDVAGLAEAVRRVTAGEADSSFSAIETYGFLWRATDQGAVGINHDATHRPRRQDREPHYLETGAFYVMDADGFRRAGHRFFGRIAIVEVPEETALEIDTPGQLELARATAPLVSAARTDRVDVDAVVTDFDGVHTDDTVGVTSDGVEQVRVSRSDGMGVRLLREAGIPVLILSTETDPVVGARARKLRVDVLQSQDDKAAALRRWADEQGIPLARIAYLGNDVNDLPALDLVGWPVAVPEAHPLVLAAARVVLDKPGGRGAVRDLAERVLRARDIRPGLRMGAADASPKEAP